MINIFILIISCIIAFLLKVLDIKLKFKESNIRLSVLDCFLEEKNSYIII